MAQIAALPKVLVRSIERVYTEESAADPENPMRRLLTQLYWELQDHVIAAGHAEEHSLNDPMAGSDCRVLQDLMYALENVV